MTTKETRSEEAVLAWQQAEATVRPSSAPRHAAAVREKRWGVVLAGGDGTRLQRLTRLICGDDRPKQFCPLLDGRTLLGHAVCRAERSVPSHQILFALTRTHREFYLKDLAGRKKQHVVQPANKGTAPPILFTLLSIQQAHRDAVVAIFPSDHHYADEERFTVALEAAFETAASHPGSVVLLGAHPDRAEIEYGWIELGAPAAAPHPGVSRVRSFREKPSLELAQAMLETASAWNTFVMVGHVGAFCEMAASAVPGVSAILRGSRLWAGDETHIEESVYSRMASTDFSRQVLSVEIGRLLVLRVHDLGWSDLGHPERVLALVERSGLRPGWLTRWNQMKRTAAAAGGADTRRVVA